MFKQSSVFSRNINQRENGQGLVEYALILVLVSVAVIVVLSQVGPEVGNIFSTVVTAVNGDAGSQSDEENNNCVQTGDRRYIIVDNGAIPAGSNYFLDSECTNQEPYSIDFDSVKVAAGAGVTPATNACQSKFGKTLRVPNDPSSEIWAGSGFWYCTP